MEGMYQPRLRNVSSRCSFSDMDNDDMSGLHDKPKIMERQRSCDERSLSELSINVPRSTDYFEGIYSPGRRSAWDTPVSSTGRQSFQPHPMVANAWEALRKSMVYFRGQPVGTLAATDHASEEVLNYDQVIAAFFIDI